MGLFTTPWRAKDRSQKRPELSQTGALRQTQQRVALLDELRRTKSHPTADELHQLVKRRLPRISLATVYRNLELLSRRGIIRKLDLAGAQRRFDADCTNHHHVRCIRCGRVDDVAGELPISVEQAFSDTHGYQITGYRLELVGVCPQCQSEQDHDAHRDQT